jgi:menaquinone-dependent protoporphyrinogen oxidase
MHVLVAYASRHGATKGIAERIAETLGKAGIQAEARPASEVKSLAGYDAFVIGSAAYMFKWLKDASSFVRRNRAVLAAKPIWFFSSGPTGGPLDAKGRDQKITTVPKDAAELAEAVHARDLRIFFGAYSRDRKPAGMAERFMSLMPAMEGVPEGDFRDWPDIEAWASGIAEELAQATPAGL